MSCTRHSIRLASSSIIKHTIMRKNSISVRASSSSSSIFWRRRTRTGRRTRTRRGRFQAAMFAKLFQWSHPQDAKPLEVEKLKELSTCVAVHYGIPSTSSILAFDPLQRLLAIGTLDGRIKVIGGNNIEGLLTSPKPLQFKHLQFLQNQGFLVSISNTNEIQVWDMEHRKLASMLKWELNITAFSVIDGTGFMYIGDDYAMVSVLKYDAETEKLVQLPYHVPGSFIAEASGVELPYRLPVVGILPQPSSKGNRILIAYANGLIALWDASENKAAWVGGHKVITLKDIRVIHITNDNRNEDTSTNDHSDKEISSLCWASTDGSVLAVGYVDGDILFWNLSTAGFTKDKQEEKSSGDVVILQLSSGDKRRPVVILRQLANRSHNNRGCQLLVYGGDEIGSVHVPTLLSLDWSSGIETLKCTARVDITLSGGLMDIIFLPTADMTAKDACLLVLINPGKLHLYDDACLSELMSQQETETSVSAPQYQGVMTMTSVEPYMTVGKLCLIVSDAKLRVSDTPTVDRTKWPLTGGVPNQFRSAEDYKVTRLYIAGYGDGSVKIWDATYPSMYLMYVLGSEVSSVSISGTALSVSAVDFCSSTLRVAVGYMCGLVRLYELIKSSNEDSLHLVTQTENEVITVHQGDGPRYRAAFSLLDSPISTLQFVNSGEILAAGFECGKVAVLDISSLSVLFLRQCVSSSSSPVMSLAVKSFSDTNCPSSSENDADSKCLDAPEKLVLFGLTKDANIFVLDGETGNIISSNSVQPKRSTTISMHIIEGNISPAEVSGEEDPPKSSQNSETNNDLTQNNSSSENKEPELNDSTGTAYFGKRLMSFLVLFCSEDELCLYSLKSVMQEDSDVIKEVKLEKPCRWITIFEQDENECWLTLLYQSGDIEIRSLPGLEVVAGSSIMSILRWDFRNQVDKTMCCMDRGHIQLVNGHEFAIVSLLTHENDFRIPESLPCLHDKALAASDTASCSSPNGTKKESGGPGILGGFIKVLKGDKVEQNVNPYEVYKKNIPHLESIFSKEPSLERDPIAVTDDENVINLNIDNIVDGWKGAKASTNKSKAETSDSIVAGWIGAKASSNTRNTNDKKATEKKKLFEGGSTTTDTKPQRRTPEDIRAKYRQMGDVASAAALAKEKLMERQEKLEELNDHAQELEDESQDFAALAKELKNKMDRRKWWQL